MNSSTHSPHRPNLTVQGNRLHLMGQGRMDTGKGSFATLGLPVESSGIVLPGKAWEWDQ